MYTFLKIYLPLYLVVSLVISFVVPTYRTWKRTGINPVTFGRTDSAHDYMGSVMKVLTVLLVAAVVCYAIGGNCYQYMVPITYLQHPGLCIAGLILLHLSLGWVALAQYQMGISWRIGIDEQHTTQLCTKGVFGISRNPIFLGMIINAAGIFLVIPNALTLLLAVTIYLAIQVQIRLEEAFLTQQHGDAYRQYKAAVHRLL